MPLADETALGLLETHGLVAGIEAADAMLKTAEVRLVSIERTVPALITIKIVGEVAAVQASVDAGRYAAERIGRVVSAHVIPRPADEVRAMMRLDAERSPGDSRSAHSGTSSTPRTRLSGSAGTSGAARTSGTSGTSGAPRRPPGSAAERPSLPKERADASPQERPLDRMTVPELRAMARELPGFPIQGRDVARARKNELIAQIRRYRSG